MNQLTKIKIYKFYYQEFIDDGSGNVKGVKTVQIEWKKDEKGMWKIVEVPGNDQIS